MIRCSNNKVKRVATPFINCIAQMYFYFRNINTSIFTGLCTVLTGNEYGNNK